MKRYAAFLVVIAVGVAALVLSQRSGPSVAPSADAFVDLIAAGERETSRLPAWVTRLSDAEEIRIGQELAGQYAPMLGSGDAVSPEMQEYVARVGKRIASGAHRHLPYEFHYIPSSRFVNAFALPGGQVYIGAGLIALMDNEDELAAVLGHELEHVDHRHCAERVQVAARLRKLDLGVVGELVQLPLELFEAGYNKEQELEADREGTRLAAATNYSPYGAITLFERMRTLHARDRLPAASPQGEVARVSWGTLAGYFRSHPLEDERIDAIRKLIRAEHWEGRTSQTALAVTLPNEVRAP